ncbi:aldehyde dehydrogenase family protein [Altererythrobacter indicus]|uniref:Aldehyde dehydrogenase family protein n=1 Tax=Altericroceibacterium indicum TaxID=374177 RepID=A0A845A6V6_9SPHN|nr:aldehyde dehydrogenase family protein [Altericroceibacterium indicum]
MSNRHIISVEPATGEAFWEGEIGNVDAAVVTACKAWRHWAAEPLAKRVELMRRFANEVRRQEEALATLISRETGKPLWEARSEVSAVIDQVEISIRAYGERTGQRRLDSALQGTSALRHRPHGVMVVLAPYNSPAHLPNGHIVPALIAGNVVILKPSEKTPAVGEFLVGCFHRAGVPEGVLQLLIGGPEEGQMLVAHADVSGILFTGSAPTGIAINRKLASTPNKIVTLEMGGNNPILVWDTPKIGDVAALIIQSAFTNAGQRCTAASRLIVKSSMYFDLIAELLKLLDRMVIGAPFDQPQPFMGPMIDTRAADLVTESFLYFLSNGGKALAHMRRPFGDLPFVTPGLIDVTGVEDRPDVEIFGPLLQIIRADDFDEAIAEANNTRFGLSASLLGGSPEEYNRFWSNIRAGIINWNRPTNAPSASAPVGGVGLSGNHRPGAYYSADHCAYPVSSSELDQPRASVGVGFEQ